MMNRVFFVPQSLVDAKKRGKARHTTLWMFSNCCFVAPPIQILNLFKNSHCLKLLFKITRQVSEDKFQS